MDFANPNPSKTTGNVEEGHVPGCRPRFLQIPLHLGEPVSLSLITPEVRKDRDSQFLWDHSCYMTIEGRAAATVCAKCAPHTGDYTKGAAVHC